MLPTGLLMSVAVNLIHIFFFYTEDKAKKTMLWETQKQYRMAALNAKKQGDLEQARLYLMASKVCKTQSTGSARL